MAMLMNRRQFCGILKITSVTVYPVDEKVLNIKGGDFTTIANQESGKNNYFFRNIMVKRSNVVISKMKHRIKGEGEMSHPYLGFIHVLACANTEIRDSIFTGHKVYKIPNANNILITVGTYDLMLVGALNPTLKNCTQFNSILDSKFWGIMCSNYSKNIMLDGCKLSRFDAHKGTFNGAIRNSEIGYVGINLVGSGKFELENSDVYSSHFINLRADYGSTWEGDIILRNVRLHSASAEKRRDVVLIRGQNSRDHDFGYQCYMPKNIEMTNVTILDTRKGSEKAVGKTPYIFADFVPVNKSGDKNLTQKYPISERVILNNVKLKSGRELSVSPNKALFKSVEIEVRTDLSK